MYAKQRIIDSEITLIPYYPNFNVSFPWYQDLDVCKQSDNIDEPYTFERLKNMYHFLNTHGECFYIQYRGTLVGDVTLRDDGEIAIVIRKESQNRHIGRRCIAEMITLAKEKQMDFVRADIYAFNTQSQAMFLAAGFKRISEEWFEYDL